MSELSVGSLSGLAANSYVIDVASGSSLDLSNATDLPASALPAGSRTSATTALSSYAGANTIYASGANFLDSPSTTSATTYKVQVRVTGGTGYVNRSFSDADASSTIRAVSSITAMEVAG